MIRLARETDLPKLEWDGVYASHRLVFQNTFAEMQQKRRLMLVAVAEEVMVGQVFVQLFSSERQFADGVNRAYLYSLRVRPPWRGRGVGTRLIAAAEASLRARGFIIAVIAAGKDNPGALKLYRRLGYHIFDEDPGVWYFTDVNGQQQSVEEPCWVMEKRLK